MTAFEYAAIFYGIIVGLALQNILTSIHKLVEAGSRVRWHWMAPIVALNAALLTLGNFWFWWIWRSAMSSHSQSIFSFLLTAFNLGLLFLACAATLPDDVPADGIVLRDYYFNNRHRIWGFGAAFYFINTCTWAMTLAQAGFNSPAVQTILIFLFGNALGAAAAILLIYVRTWWCHAICIVFGTISLLSIYGPMRL